MIRPLRSAHRRIFMVLAVFLPVLVVAGLITRHPVEEDQASTATTSLARPASHGIISLQKSGSQIEVLAAREIDSPDLLMYWTAASGTVSLDDKSVLLGRFVPGQANRYVLTSDNGTLVLYSVATGTIVDTRQIGGGK